MEHSMTKYRATWTETATHETRVGPWRDTVKEAKADAYTKMYPPYPNTIRITTEPAD